MSETLPALANGLARTLEASHLNAVANDPAVRPWLGGDGPLDLTALVADPVNVALTTPAGGFLGIAHGFGCYEVHSLFGREGRGRETIPAMRAALAYMFTATDAIEMVTKVPQDNKAAAGLARLGGFEVAWTRRLPWSGGTLVDTDFLRLTLLRWALRAAVTAELGQWFHHALAHAKAQAHSDLPTHAEDPIHDAMVGAAILMVRAGNLRKAVATYNPWARFAGYTPITILREQPVVLDLGEAVVEARGETMEILLCR